ncbi:pancreatic secretory granule membrane major glycoprotein GP2-like isoform X2 [Aquarana catesbeiana]|uniref:pancreatic secretory granule membrane major glycoprotein GP2-like isoform X2 n=1 Tax=Aquarana catesbeiana TaxID=8400 RepID=UPI003CC9798B
MRLGQPRVRCWKVWDSRLIKAFYSWTSSASVGLCSSCAGVCYEYSGCYCSNGFDVCLPDVNIPCDVNDLSYCCPPGLYYNHTASCCTETSICFQECASDEVCDMGVCVCNYSIYQDKNLTDLHPALICATDVMTGLVSQCLLSYLGYDLTSIHLMTSSNFCTFSYSDIFNGQKVTALQALPTSNWCGNRVTEEGSRLFVTNTIDIGAPVNSNITASPISFNITCPLFTGTYPLARTVVISGVNAMELYPLTMAAYNDTEFMAPYTADQRILGSEVYVALYAYMDGETYVLRLQDCTASPTADHNNIKALHLVSQGCATDNLTRILQNGNSTEVRLEIRPSQFPDFATIYLFCDVRFCVKSEEECTACKESQYFSMGVTQLQLALKIAGNSQQ